MMHRNETWTARGQRRKPLWINDERSLGQGVPPTPTLDLAARRQRPPAGKIAAVLVRCKLARALPRSIVRGLKIVWR